jgi:hypothetical protein
MGYDIMAKLGREVEGRMKGIFTLFVEDTKDIKKLPNLENKYLLDQVGHIAIADNDSSITKEDIDTLMAFGDRFIITLETPKINLPMCDIPNRLNLVLIVDHPQFFQLKDTDQIKLIPKESMLTTLPEAFNDDKEVTIV